MGIRSQIRNKKRFVSDSGGHGITLFVWVCLVSLAVHLGLFALVYLFHDVNFFPPKPRVVRVDLVSFVPGQTKPAPAQAEPESEPVPESVPENKDSVNLNLKPLAPIQVSEPVTVLKPDISLKAKPKNIKQLMVARKIKAKPVEKKTSRKLKPKPKKTPEKALEAARKNLADKVKDRNKSQIDQALKRMQATIKGKNKSAQQGDGTVAGSGSGSQGNIPLTLYQIGLKNAIKQNWVFNDAMAGMNQSLEVRVFIKILKSGEIRDISFETRSGNQYLDESAKKAIRRAGPLGELPEGMASYELVVGFTPKGLK